LILDGLQSQIEEMIDQARVDDVEMPQLGALLMLLTGCRSWEVPPHMQASPKEAPIIHGGMV